MNPSEGNDTLKGLKGEATGSLADVVPSRHDEIESPHLRSRRHYARLILPCGIVVIAVIVTAFALATRWRRATAPQLPATPVDKRLESAQQEVNEGEKLYNEGHHIIVPNNEEKLARARAHYEQAWVNLTNQEWPDGAVMVNDGRWRELLELCRTRLTYLKYLGP